MGNKHLLAALSLLGLIGFSGCGSSSTQTLQSCVEDHMKEKLSEADSITECLVDELAKTFATQPDCEAFASANGAYGTSKTEACQHYFQEKTADGSVGN